MYVDDFQLTGKKQNMDPMWKIYMKDVDLGEPTLFFYHVYLSCTQRECQTSKDIFRQLQKYVRIQDFRWDHGKLFVSGKSDANISSWSYDMEGHAKKSVERYCELANKTTQQLCKVATPCLDVHQFIEEMGCVGELSEVCSQIVLKCLYLARIGRPDIFMVREQTCSCSHTVDQSL